MEYTIENELSIHKINSTYNKYSTESTFLNAQGPAGPPGAHGPAGDGDSVTGEELIGVINGVNVNFALSNTPTFGAKIFLNGMRLREGEDYTRSSNTLTFQNPPIAGDILLADYNY